MRMRSVTVLAVVGAVATAVYAAQTSAPKAPPKAAAQKPVAKTQPATQTPTFKTQKDKVSYCIGVQMGKNLKQRGIEVNADQVAKGLRDGVTGGKLLLTEEALRATLTEFNQGLMKKRAEELQVIAEKNKKEGDAFLASNKQKEGVVTLESGLQYKILKEGTGKTPTADDTIECNYRGTLIDGTEFDSSYRRGQAMTIKVSNVIPGWTEALKLMPVGSRWQLFIPPNLAYGTRGAGPQIGPNTTLIFEVELLDIKSPAAPPQP